MIRGDHTATPSQPMGRYAWIDSNSIHYINTGITTVEWLNCTDTVSIDASIGAHGAVIIRNSISDAEKILMHGNWILKKAQMQKIMQ